MSLYDDVAVCLASEQRELFLARLAHSLTISARGSYVETGNSVEAASVGLRCYNELQHTIAGALRVAIHNENAWAGPDDEFAQALIKQARAFGGCEAGLIWALQNAVKLTVRSQ